MARKPSLFETAKRERDAMHRIRYGRVSLMLQGPLDDTTRREILTLLLERHPSGGWVYSSGVVARVLSQHKLVEGPALSVDEVKNWRTSNADTTPLEAA